MIIRLSPIANFDAPELILSLFELYAFGIGEAVFSDLPIDYETILADVESEPVKYGLENEIDILKDEPVAARQLIEEILVSRVMELFDARTAQYGTNYAFERVHGAQSSIRLRAGDISAVALATAWMSFFHVVDAGEALDMTQDEVKALRMRYAKVFELVALLACTAIGHSVAWWTGRSWSDEAKISNFETLCKVVGNGKVKAVADWEESERQSKDAGVDGFLVTTIGGRITSGSICLALGATVQKNQRQKKKIGKDQRDRLLSFYVNRPTIAFLGAAADPYPHEPSLAQDYARADCLYLHGEALWSLLRIYSSQPVHEDVSSMNLKIEAALKAETYSALTGAKIVVSGATFDLTNGVADYAPAA